MIRNTSGIRLHFHILWTDGKLDWERHSTRAEAEAAARDLAREGELWTIVEKDQSCPQCKRSAGYRPNRSIA